LCKGFGKGRVQGCTADVVHEGVSCDGCHVTPILGSRHKSLEWDNYDLCAACHARADREETLGVPADHQFKTIPAEGSGVQEPSSSASPESASSFNCKNFDGIIALLEGFGIDVLQLVHKIAGVCCSTVQMLGEESLFPLLELLSPLIAQDADVGAFISAMQDVLGIVQAADWHVQKKFWKQCGLSVHGVLQEMGVGANVMTGPMMALGKGLRKGFGKGCKGNGKARCLRKMAECWMREAGPVAGQGVEHSKSEDEPLPAHMGVVCDGCEQNPLVGPRHRSLERSDFDLCSVCHSREDRDAAFGLQPEHKFEVLQPTFQSPLMAMARAFQLCKGFGKGRVQGCTADVVHEGVSCDGCHVTPILGSRHKSLEWDNYDLCAACHARQNREETLGVPANHQFKTIPAEGSGVQDSASSFDCKNLDGIIALLEGCGIDVLRLAHKIAGVCCSTVQMLGEESLLPVLQFLSPLIAPDADAGAHVGAFTSAMKDVLGIVLAADWPVQKKFWKQCGLSIHGVLQEMGVGMGLWKAWAKGCKGFGKGCGGNGKGKCSRNISKSFERQASGEVARHNVYETAFATLLSHCDEKIRFAAETALGEAQSTKAREVSHTVGSELPEPSVCDAAPAVVEPFVGSLPKDGAQVIHEDTRSEESWLMEDVQQEAVGVLPQSSSVSALMVGEPAITVSSPSLLFDSDQNSDVTSDWMPVLSQFPMMNHACLLGRISWKESCSEEHFAVVTVRIQVLNNGQEAWPESTVLRIAAGNPFGMHEMPIGAVACAQVADFELNLVVPVAMEQTRSAWAMTVDGQPFGPLMILEAF